MGLLPALYALPEKRPALEPKLALPVPQATNVERMAPLYVRQAAIAITTVIARIARPGLDVPVAPIELLAHLGVRARRLPHLLIEREQHVILAKLESINETRGRPRVLTAPKDSSAQSRPLHQSNAATLLYIALPIHLLLWQQRQDIIQYQKSTQTREN